MYVKGQIHDTRLTELENDSLEMIWVSILNDNQRILFGVCYRPPGQPAGQVAEFLANLENSLALIACKKYDTVILVGDFNDPCTKWNSRHTKSDLKNNLVDLSLSYNMKQLINEPTRDENILDLVFTTNPTVFRKVAALDPIHDLDHLPIYCEINFKVKVKRKTQRRVWHYENGNYDALKNCLNETPWHVFMGNCDDVDEMVDMFSNILNSACSDYIPNFVVTVDKNDKLGMTNKIKKLFKKCNRLHRTYKSSLSDGDKVKYIAARNEAKNQWRKAKKGFLKLNEKMMDKETSSKQWWKIARG